MKIETQQLEDHQVKLTVEIEQEPFEQAKRIAARKIAKKSKIPGFRPGKAPYHVVQRFVGDNTIFEDGLEILIKDMYPEIIDQAGIDPYGPGSLEKIVQVEPLILEFVVPLAAKVTLGDYRSMRFPHEPKPVEDAEVEETLNKLRENQAIEEPVDRPAQEGDRVFIRLQATQLDGPDGPQSVLIPERQVSFIISADSDVVAQAWPFPGFTKELIGLSVGDKKNLQHTFSDDIEFETLKGATAEFSIEVDEVKSHTLPEVDDDFAQNAGDFENVDMMLQEIRKQLEEHAEAEYNENYNEKIVNHVVEFSEVQYPPQMLEDEINEVIHNLEHRLKNQNIDLDTYMKIREIDEEGMRAEAIPIAESRLKQTLVLVEISKAENVKLDQDEVQQETARVLEAMSNYMPESEFKKIPQDKLLPNLINNVIADMRLRQTIERLNLIAKGEYPLSEGASEQLEDDESDEEQAVGEEDTELAESNGDAEEIKLDETEKPSESEESLS
ncbi:MAG: trigger factor [Anaerolineales bacterium]|nr:trigger factor [Anaerolineales bacterium]